VLEGKPEAKGFQCPLKVTSLAFRAWNRGLAATTSPDLPEKNAYGVWLFNGTSWEPSIGFPGPKTCPGHKVIWAGKLDYWLYGGLGGVRSEWGSLCRFDGQTLEWQAFELPETAQLRLQEGTGTKLGTLTSAACFAWNNCWFFGSFGVVLHWNGEALLDASPELLSNWPRSEYTAAVGRVSPSGSPFGLALGSVFEFFSHHEEPTLGPEGEKRWAYYPAPKHNGSFAPELYASSGGPFSGLPGSLSPEAKYPGRTELTAVDFDAEGHGWVGVGPAGKRWSNAFGEAPPEEIPTETPAPVALVPISTSGTRATSCKGPPERRFTFTAIGPGVPFTEPRFFWLSLAAVPVASRAEAEAMAGGFSQPAASSAGEHEPVIVRATCEGQTSVTRFRLEVPTLGFLPDDRNGSVTAVAATNAANESWAAAEEGGLPPNPVKEIPPVSEPPHLYRLTDGEPPDAPEGDDFEERPVHLTIEAPTVVLEPPPPPPPPPPPTAVNHTRHVKLPPAIYDVKAKLRGKRNLYLSFKVRRTVTLGAEGLRHGHVVAEAPPRRFTGRTGVLVLRLNPKRWPTKVRFIT
jgi:hypothetical protein